MHDDQSQVSRANYGPVWNRDLRLRGAVSHPRLRGCDTRNPRYISFSNFSPYGWAVARIMATIMHLLGFFQFSPWDTQE
jgi:hypothetical protein